ncbi:MAG: hypothetical protein RSD46_00300 [Oscillospiraceae bacterium]
MGGFFVLFEKKIDPLCLYCERGCALGDDEILCIKKGVVSPGFHCHAFRYDPLKRTPPKPAAVEATGLSQEDFTL